MDDAILLVCGGRDYAGSVACLADLPFRIGILVHGNATGADTLAGEWATARGIHTAAVPALWDFYRKSAGHTRNAAMLLLRPTYCVAFPGGPGTAGMVKLCELARIPVWRPYG